MKRKTGKQRGGPGLKAAGLTALAVLVLSFGASWAYYSGAMTMENPFHMGSSGAAMVENFDPSSSFLPGETAVKEIAFQNTGKMDLFLRVEVPPKEGWFQRGEKKEELLTGYVEKNWAKGVWIPEGFEGELSIEKYQEDEVETDLWTKAYPAENGKAYRYYKKILPAGQTTEIILESIRLSPQVSNDRHAPDYSGKTYRLDFRAEAVPVEADGSGLGVQAEWGMTVSEAEDGTLSWSAADGD